MSEANVNKLERVDYASTAMPLSKQNDALRFSRSYREWISVTIQDSYPLPRMDENNDALVNAAIILKVNTQSSYLQIAIDKGG